MSKTIKVRNALTGVVREVQVADELLGVPVPVPVKRKPKGEKPAPVVPPVVVGGDGDGADRV